MKIKGMAGALLNWEREADVARGLAAGHLICDRCGWSSDDPEFEVCADCFSEIDLRAALRGEHGKREQREARGSIRTNP